MKCYAFLNGKVAAILIKAVTSLLLCRLFQASNIKKNAHYQPNKKSLKIPKEYSESINRKMTDNTMANRKTTKGQTTLYKTLHIKLKIE